MINFTWEDFEEADKKMNELYEEEDCLIRELDEVRRKRVIAEDERNFIGDWLKRNGVAEAKNWAVGKAGTISF